MSWVATAIVGGAVVGAGATMYASNKASSASSEAAATQAASTASSTQMQLDYLRETRADLADAVNKGLIDLDTAFNAAIENLSPGDVNAIQEYANLLSHPESVMSRPGVQFQYNQGLEALQAGFSRTSGGGLSGRMIKAAEEYGQNFASMALDRELARLEPLITNQTNISNLYSNLGTSKANLRVGGQAQIAGVTGQAIPAIASGIQSQGNIAASNLINQSNIATNAASNISNLANDAALTYAMYKSGLFKGV